MALCRVILLLAVLSHRVLAVSSHDEQRVVDLARQGEARPADMRHDDDDDGKSPQSAEVSLGRNTDASRNDSESSSQQLVPQVEIVYDSTGKGWVDQVKQVPDPASSPSRGARRADSARKDIIGTEIINDVAYLEIRQDKGQKSAPLLSVKRVDSESTNATTSKKADSEATHTGKIHYSQIPFQEASTTANSASEEVEDYSHEDQAETHDTTTTTETPTEPSIDSEETEETGSPAPKKGSDPADATVTEPEDEEGEFHDYEDEAVSSEDHSPTSEHSRSESTTTSVSPSSAEIDYEEDNEEHDTEGVGDDGSPTSTAPSSNVTETVQPEHNGNEATSPPLETSTVRQIPISKITTPSVNFVMPTESAIVSEESTDPVTEALDENDSREDAPAAERESSDHSKTEHPSSTLKSSEQAQQSSSDSDENSSEVVTESSAISTNPSTDETTTEIRTVDATDVISVHDDEEDDEPDATALPRKETTESTVKASNSSSFQNHVAVPSANSSETPMDVTSSGDAAAVKTTVEAVRETTIPSENLGREIDDDAFPTEKSNPTPDFFSQFVTVNPNMFYGIFKPSPTPQPVVESSGGSSTAASATLHPPTSTSTTLKPTTTTPFPTTTSTTTSRTTTTSISSAPKPAPILHQRDPAPTDPGFVLGLEGLFNLNPSANLKSSEPPRPSVARFGNSFETLKQAEETTKAPASPTSTSIPSFFGDGAPLEMLHFPWSTNDNEFSGPRASLNDGRRDASLATASSSTTTTTKATPTVSPTTSPATTTTFQSRVNLFSKKIAPTLVPTRAPPSGPPKKFNLFASLTNTNNPMGHKTDRRPELRPLKKVSGPWEPTIEAPEEDDSPGFQDAEAPPERKAFFGKPSFERRLVLENLSPSTTKRPATHPQFHPPTLLHDFAVPPPLDHRNYDMDDFLHRGTPATPRNAKSPISSKARTTLLMCAAIIGGAAIFFATLMVVCMRRTKNKRLIRRRAIDKFIQDSNSESSSSYGGSHSSYGRKGLLA